MDLIISLSCTVNPECVFPLCRFVAKPTKLSWDCRAKPDQTSLAHLHGSVEKLSSCDQGI